MLDNGRQSALGNQLYEMEVVRAVLETSVFTSIAKNTDYDLQHA